MNFLKFKFASMLRRSGLLEPLKMEAAWSGSNWPVMQFNISQDLNFCQHCCENRELYNEFF